MFKIIQCSSRHSVNGQQHLRRVSCHFNTEQPAEHRFPFHTYTYRQNRCKLSILIIFVWRRVLIGFQGLPQGRSCMLQRRWAAELEVGLFSFEQCRLFLCLPIETYWNALWTATNGATNIVTHSRPFPNLCMTLQLSSFMYSFLESLTRRRLHNLQIAILDHMAVQTPHNAFHTKPTKRLFYHLWQSVMFTFLLFRSSLRAWRSKRANMAWPFKYQQLIHYSLYIAEYVPRTDLLQSPSAYQQIYPPDHNRSE